MLNKLLSIVTISILFPLVLSASTFDLVIYTWGDVDSIYNAFNSVALMLNDSSFVGNIEYILVLVSALLAGKWLLQENFKMAFAEIAYVMAVMTLVYGTTEDVNIVDIRSSMDVNTSQYQTVSNVPFMLGFTAYSSSIFTKYMVEQIDASTATLNEQSYSSMGFLQNMQFLKNQLLVVDTITNTNSDYLALSKYYNKCIMKNVLDIDEAQFARISNPNAPIGDIITPTNLGISSFAYDSVQTCGDYYIDSNVSGSLDSLGALLSGLDYNTTGVRNTTAIEASFMQLIDATGSLNDLNQANSNLIAASLYSKSANFAGIGVSGVDDANRVSVASSKLSLIQNGAGQFAWMADMLPKAMHLLTVIILLAYIPMGVVVSVLGMTRGLKILMNFMFGYIAFQSIHIALAITQNVTNSYAQQGAVSKLAVLSGSSMGAAQIPSYIQYLSEMTGLAGLLGVAAIPVVVGIMYRGEVMAASGVAMGVGGAFKSLGTDGAKDAMHDNFTKNLAEDNAENRMTSEEKVARARMARMGINVPSSGSAIMALSEVEAGMEKANKAAAVSSSMLTPGGVDSLNVGAGVKSNQEQQSKVAFGEQSVMVAGGELSAITNAKAAGTVEGIKGAASIMSAGQTAINEGVASLNGSVNGGEGTQNLSRAVGTSTAEELSALVKTGEVLGSQTDGVTNAIKAAKLKAVQDTRSKISTGKHGDEEAFGTVADQNAEIAAKAIIYTAKRRKQLNGGVDDVGNPTEAWSADKIAEGQAISAVQGEIKQQGVLNSLTKEANTKNEGDDSKSFRRASMASEFSGRKEENEQLGIGKKWAEISKDGKGDISMMSKVQDNAAVAAIGGITAAYKAISRAGSVDKAIAVANTLADEKAIGSVEHAKNLTKTYGNNLEGRKGALSELKKNASKAATEAQAVLDDDNATDAQKSAAEKKLTSANAMKHATAKSLSLAGVMGAIDKTKVDSMMGQAMGINANKTSVDYVENAMYGEMSKQQSTKAKIDTQGGVATSVVSDVAEAKLKAAKQQMGTQSELQQQIASKMTGGTKEEQQKAAENIAKAIMQGGDNLAGSLSSVLGKGIKIDGLGDGAKVSDAASLATVGAGALAGTLMGGKTKSDLAATGVYNSPEEYATAQAQKASGMATVDKTRTSKSLDQKQTQKKVDDLYDKVDDIELLESQLIRSGAVEIGTDNKPLRAKNGNLKALTGPSFTNALSMFGAGDMASTSQMIVAGTRVNQDTDMDGNTLSNADSSQSKSSGFKNNINAKGVYATAIAKNLADNPNDPKEVHALRDTLMHTTDMTSFMTNKDGGLMGITSAGMKALKTSGLMSSKQLQKLDDMFIEKKVDGEDGVGAGSYLLAGGMMTAGALGINKIAGNPAGKVGKYAASKSPFRKDSGEKETKNGGTNNQYGEPSDPPDNKTSNHNDSFEGKRYNEGGGNTKEYQSHMESVAKKANRSKILKNIGKDVIKGAGVTFAADELIQTTLDDGNTERANVYQAIVNTGEGVGTAVVGGVSTVAGGIDKVIESVAGFKPIGSATKAVGLTKSNDLVQTGVELVDEASDSIVDAALNIQDAASGSDTVRGRTKGGDTMLGSALGYGSVSKQIGSSGEGSIQKEGNAAAEWMTTSHGLSGGSGQIPGSSGYEGSGQTASTKSGGAPASNAESIKPTIDTSDISQAVASAIGSINITPTNGSAGSDGGYASVFNGGNAPEVNSTVSTVTGTADTNQGMGGGYVGAVLSEGKAEANIAATKSTKVNTEHATNDFVQQGDMVDELRKFNAKVDSKNMMKNGRDDADA